MAGEWQNVEFGDLLPNGTRNGVYKGKAFHGTGIKIVNMGELFAYPRLRDVPMKRVELSESELEKSSLQVGDLLFARRSLVAEGAGKCSIVMEVNEPTTFESSIIRARPDARRVNSLFLYYLFSSLQGRYLLGTILRQVAVSGITGTDLVKLRFPLPPMKEQQAIACILGALDDKIELNRRMNRPLEDIARAIFKSWFVDFDPVRAKAEGRDPGLPKHIADLFPDSFEESELGEIPKGWEVGIIEDLGEVVCGKTPPTADRENYGENVPFVTIPDMWGRVFVTKTEKALSAKGAETQKSKFLPPFSICVSCIGTLGLVALTSTLCQTNQQINSVIPSDPNTSILNYLILGGLGEQIRYRGAGGSVLLNLSKGQFSSMKVIRPPVCVSRIFQRVALPIMKRILNNQRECETLQSMQDVLLPKLISGELRVLNAERILERLV